MTSTMIPTIRYRDAPRVIGWLCDACGFERHCIVPGDGGSVDADAHCARAATAGAEIVYGSRESCARDREGQVRRFGTGYP